MKQDYRDGGLITVPHTLYENFTHMKPCAFSLNGKKYEASDWKDTLLNTCNSLSQINADKFVAQDNLLRKYIH